MRTITFYSYKGGVGRSLLVANAAKYLSTLGKRVFALDLDLEAPGLHYKFELGWDSPRSRSVPGVVDVLDYFRENGVLPDSLSVYAPPVEVAAGREPIRVMRAGTAPHGDYWRTLSRINWHELFYGAEPMGVMFFLELKERIKREFNPDFLLIDARTGITEMGGIATTVLADIVVCLALASAEHLEGLRAVMQGIRQTASRDGKRVPPAIVPVISRLPNRKEASIEDMELARIRAFLNTPVSDGAPNLDLAEIVTLHSEPLLDSEEQLLVGGKNSPHDLPLLRDYLMLFSKVIPAEDIRPHVGQLIQQATSRLLEDPDAAQSDLEALTAYCADQEAYRALLKLYQLRKAPLEKLVATAALMWQLGSSVSNPDPLLLDIVKTAFSEPRATDVQKKYAEFAEVVWRSNGMKDIRVGMTIANAYLPERRDRAIQLLSDYIERADPPNSVAIVRLIKLLSGTSPKQTMSLIERFKGLEPSLEFQAAWARFVVDQKDRALADQLLQDPSFRVDSVTSGDPATAYRLLKLAGSKTSAAILLEAIDAAVADHDLPRLRDLGEVLLEEGRLEVLSSRMQGRLPDSAFDEVMQTIGRRGRRVRLLESELKL